MFESLLAQIQLIVGSLNGWVTTALHGNTLVAGAVTASILASVFYLLRKLPEVMWNRIRRYIFFTYEIQYDEMESRSMNSIMADKFEYELQKHVARRRPSARLTTRKKRLAESLSDGGFFFFYEGAWIWISRQRLSKGNEAVATSASNNVMLVNLTLTAFRFHREKMISVLQSTTKEFMVAGIYQVKTPSYSSGNPRISRVRNFTTLPVLAIDREVKEKIDRAIANFLLKRVEHNRLDRPHKLVFMLYGEPGTGKSALGEYIAHKLKTSLFCINGQSASGNHMSSLNLSEVLVSCRDNIVDEEIPVVLCDDFDTYWEGLKKREPKDPSENSNKLDSFDGAELGRMLSTLQSPTEINDCVIIFTTNHLEKIDPAMYRPGRVTAMIEIGRMTEQSVIEYFELSYKKPWPSGLRIARSLRACDISSIFEQHEEDPDGFLHEIVKVKQADDEVFAKQTLELVA